MIVPLERVSVALVQAYCAPCTVSWYAFGFGYGWGCMSGIIECDTCLRCVFYDGPFEDKYLRQTNAPTYTRQLPSAMWNKLFPASLPACLCGGRFRTDSRHHYSPEWNGRQHSHLHLCPVCRNGNSSLRPLDAAARKAMPECLWAPYMNRLLDIGPNDGYGEPSTEVVQYIDWNDPVYKKPRLLVGQGLLDGQVTDAF